MSGGSLPVTGATITIGGVALTTTTWATAATAMIAVGIVLVAATAIRTRWQRRQHLS